MWLDGYTVLCRECPDLVAVYESSGGRLALLLRHTPVPLIQEYGAWRAETRKAARIIVDLQTIVSREVNPLDPAVVTVGAIHGGTKHNIIPNDVKLQLTIRTTKDSVRKHVLEAIDRIAKAAAIGARAPEPIVKVDPGEFTPALVNDGPLTQKTAALFKEVLGADRVKVRPPTMGGEDFGRFGREGVPIFMYFLGTVPPEKVAESRKKDEPLPSLHSDLYAPVPEPSIRTGVTTLAASVLNLMGK